MLRLKDVWNLRDQLIATWLPLHVLDLRLVVYADDIGVKFMRSPLYQIRRKRINVTRGRLEVPVDAIEDLARTIVLQRNASANSFAGHDRVLYHAPVPREMYPLSFTWKMQMKGRHGVA
jgi:hypothetical protein